MTDPSDSQSAERLHELAWVTEINAYLYDLRIAMAMLIVLQVKLRMGAIAPETDIYAAVDEALAPIITRFQER